MRNNTAANPFAQRAVYWKMQFILPALAVGTAEDAFADLAVSVSTFETDEANHIWTFELICGEKCEEEVARRLLVISSLHNIPQPELIVEQLVQEDWLSQVARDFPPLSIGRFYVHGSHVETPPAPGMIAIQVDAGAAFGSGEHGTTSCCLKAIDWLANQRHFSRVLDMGTGSGILAIAAAKLWKCNVLAVDIDPVSVRVTGENVATNKVSPYVCMGVSDGYNSSHVKRGVDGKGKYDLILSNILARPLVAFAPSLEKHLAKGGVAVLSGLLTNQETMVRSAHRLQGLSLKKRFVQGDWCTLVLER